MRCLSLKCTSTKSKHCGLSKNNFADKKKKKILVQLYPLKLYLFFLNCLVTDASQGLELWPQIIQKLQIISQVAEWHLIQWQAFAFLSLVGILVGLVHWVLYMVSINHVQFPVNVICNVLIWQQAERALVRWWSSLVGVVPVCSPGRVLKFRK